MFYAQRIFEKCDVEEKWELDKVVIIFCVK
jgi:hypothetical protein